LAASKTGTGTLVERVEVAAMEAAVGVTIVTVETTDAAMTVMTTGVEATTIVGAIKTDSYK
jgi:hypothetical protein